MKASPLLSEVGAVFVPVQHIEEARDWYCRILGIDADQDILFGHLYCIPLQKGVTLILDSKIFPKKTPSDAPLFHFNTQDIEAAYQHMQELDVELVSGIENGHWFTFRDPDRNVLMVCKC
ncbi:VOC family protein [Brevibacillus centrosporus]|jgi:catechol 2,3-dioxygenase-like lactoylglutathione lyase family enzyme|uniref:Glyoxalase/Bleomycin resistance protein/Dioxygenase superfamily protein n=1 Tax=Brevibacillus centrosporus TaxID=54910 RepID=A0A1I3T7Y7_9BACL|nr:VOC family protein [Brevibacillus centrosporus]MEC2128303.1 VOC family protein [Brevibacillus centrosporus]MED1953942.1 VOC family protein [Brevibacillus centrosporus]MED4909726.1 VOC family protein [Brevibacillus centrosporus]RNB73845.1 VOC family protein [Brevibacillus centrosporus]SFJ67258.1 Glyoxalase/Bleomycin resistance protein/Dioxygenase superfamily protein [Brevibacillus centrosporus]